jgi:hypothetical protein
MLAHKASLIKKKSVLISVAKHPRHPRSKIIVNFMRFIVFIVIVEMLGSMTN